MDKIKIRKIIYKLRTKYLTINNVVVAVAFVIALSWVWGALEMMQRNYSLQHEVDGRKRQLALVELQKDSLSLQGRYYKTDEYLELAARENLGLVQPGEKMFILPKESSAVTGEGSDENEDSVTIAKKSIEPSNFEQWMNFLFGGNSKMLK